MPLLAALLVAAPRVLRQLQPAALRRQPITACVLALLPAVVLSHVPHLFLWGMKNSGILFAKVVLFYLVMVAVVNTPSRLRRLLAVGARSRPMQSSTSTGRRFALLACRAAAASPGPRNWHCSISR